MPRRKKHSRHLYVSGILFCLHLLSPAHAKAEAVGPVSQQQKVIVDNNRAELNRISRSVDTDVSAVLQNQAAIRAGLQSASSTTAADLQTLSTLVKTVRSETAAFKDALVQEFDATRVVEETASREIQFVEARIQRDQESGHMDSVQRDAERLSAVLNEEQEKLTNIYMSINTMISHYQTGMNSKISQENELQKSALAPNKF